MAEFEEVLELDEVLDKHELLPSKWLPLFHKEKITKSDQILAIKGDHECYQNLSSNATDTKEQQALRQLLDIPEASSNPDAELERKIQEAGLDSNFWLPVFKDELGVTSLHALVHIGGESFGMLQQFVRKPWEKKALRKFLGMNGEETSFKAHRQMQREKLQENQEASKHMLQQLKILHMEGKERHDNGVQQIESRIRQSLQISPHAWIPSDTNLETTVSSLEKSICELEVILQTRTELSDVDVLKNASGGLALQGILLSRNLDDQMQSRDRLLKPPDDILLMGPSLSKFEKIEEFSSQYQEDHFRRSMDKLGYSASASATRDYWGFSGDMGGTYSKPSESEVASEDHQNELYSSTMKYSFVPFASSYFNDSQLLLSDDALKQLKDIENLIISEPKDSAVQDECQQFFIKFGSHAPKGHLHFGGIYWRKSVSEGFEQKTMRTVKRLQREVVNFKASISFGCFVGASAEANRSTVEASLSGKYSEDLIRMTTLEVTATGGPPDVSSLPQWKSGMAASNSTWSLIDRGTNTVPVWDIIKMNHKKDFKNPEKLAHTLHQAWEKMTKVNPESSEPIQEAEDAVQAMDIKSWSETEETAECEQHLSDLLEVKRDIIFRKSMNLQAWPDLYLSQPTVQEYLRFAMRANQDNNSDDKEYIKLYMRQLVTPLDVCIVKELTDISEWLYHTDKDDAVMPLECTDIVNLKMIAESKLDEMILAKGRSSSLYKESPEQQEVKIRATATVAKAVNCVLNGFKEAKRKYEELCLVTLLFPCQYETRDRIFLRLLSTCDLEYLKKELEEHNKGFVTEPPMKAQAYLFHLTVEMYNREDVYVTEAQVKHHLKFLQTELMDDIDPHVGRVLVQLHSGECEWEKLLSRLVSLENGILLEKKYEGKELIHILSDRKSARPSLHFESTSISKPVHEFPSGNVQKLFKELHLLKYYSQKLTLQDALLIRKETLGNKSCANLELLPYFILQKLMMHDFKCRGVLFKKKTTSNSLALTKASQQHDEFDFFDDFDDIPPNAAIASSSSGTTLSTVNPMDGLLALLHSSDNFLRQELTNKLSTCQLAIPFLLPDPFTHTLSLSLWAMRTISKEWKCTDLHTGKVQSEGHPIVKYPSPIVSFFRLTRNRSEHSKSRLLNAVISASDSPHNYFFNFHCDGGNTESFLMDGLVELCWYLPAGKPNESDHFAQVITFTNLRGDALSHPKQTEFLSQVSFMNFVLLTEDNLDEKGIKFLQSLARAPGGIVLLFLDKNFTQKARMTQLMSAIPKQKCFRMKGSGRSEADIKDSIRKQINNKLACLQQDFITIEDCAEVARGNEIAVDEDDQQCRQGRELACDVQKVLTELKTTDKDDVLPLQGSKLWNEWARKDKERHRHINKCAKGVEQYNESMENQKLVIRMQQLSIAKSPSPLIKTFLSNLLKHEGGIRNYFLQWLKLFLEDHSRNILPKLFHQYQATRMQLLKLQLEHKTGKEEAKRVLKEKLQQLNEILVHASIGLEHLLREIGQIYEAAVELKDTSPELREQVEHLPQVAAELLVSGYPLELMDGDASHVPLRWVIAVLDKLRELLQDANLSVISVLGIQSTGKSTLLNILFGLRFAVSAGRCTRGAFMQLLSLDKALKKETMCDYLLIIDTEGLRAPELSSLETQLHDNELATFVIGLANVTLINIFGQTPGDMEDILQRAVHAFIRMEHVGLKPSCQFVHQNVGKISSAIRGMMGRVNFQEKLDKMTKAAADEEGLGDHYTMFSHVIDFSEEKDVWCFPGLWKGDPPMSPVNPGYSDRAQELKSGLIEMTNVHCLLSVFQARIKDLWKAILHENFIFSFKNTLEIIAYNNLDAKYAQWSWEFQRRMLQWQEGAKHRIESTPLDKLNDFQRYLMNELIEEGTEIHAELESEMNKFFEESKQRDILVQWQRRTQLRLHEVRKEHEVYTKQQCIVLFTGRQALAKADTMKQHHQNELLLLVKGHVSNLKKGMLNDEELNELFEDKWLEWMTDLKSSQQIDQSYPDIESYLENCLRDLLGNRYNLLSPKLSATPLRIRNKKSLTFTLVKNTHITVNRQLRVGKFLRGQSNSFGYLQPFHVDTADRETKRFLAQAEEYLDGKKRLKQNFNPIFCHELLKNLLEAITYSQKECPEFSFTPEYKVDIALTVCGYAKVVFEGMAEHFRRMNDPIVYLQREMKTPYLRLFKSLYQQTAQEKTAAYNLCDRLIKPIEEALKGSLAQKIAVDVKSSSSHFSTKKALKAKIINDLAEKNDFNEYAVYLKDVKRSVKSWVRRYTEQHCNQSQSGKTRFIVLAETDLGCLVASIGTAAKKVTRSFPEADIKKWLDKFHGEVMMELSLDLGEMQKVVGDLKDLKNFTEEFCKNLAVLNVDEFKSLHDMDKWDEKPHDILLKTLIGCTEQCPFCQEQCELTNSNHSGTKHTADLHRSLCLGGKRWRGTDEMVLETCNALVASSRVFWHHESMTSHPFKKYQEVYDTWTITPDGSLEVASYWKWFLAEYSREVAYLYRIEPAEIPRSWKSLTLEKVKEDLKTLYQL